jgi:hypothetical protein
LKADQADGGPAWPDHRIAEALDLSVGVLPARLHESVWLIG